MVANLGLPSLGGLSANSSLFQGLDTPYLVRGGTGGAGQGCCVGTG